MSKHAMRRSRWSTLKAIGSVVVVVAFLGFFLASVFGAIGGEERPQGRLAGVDQPTSGEPSTAAETGSDPAQEASDGPAPDQTIQKVHEAKRLKRTIEWLRRNLADETTFRVASFNVLGDSHTRPGGNRKGWAGSLTRMGWANTLINNTGVSVVGFQEFEHPQFYRFLALNGSWEAYPGPTLDRGSIRNSLAWDTNVWNLVEARDIGIPYFGGQIIRRPVVLLENIESEREVWFFNTHNPADVGGNQAAHRARAIALEIALANELNNDGTPVVFTGDYNDRAEAFCPLTQGSPLVAAAGGSAAGSGCVLPPRPGVDWIFGAGVRWDAYESLTRGIVGRISDHPYLWAEGFIPQEPIPPAKSNKPEKKAGGNKS